MNILLVSPYPELSKLAEEISQELNHRIKVETAVLDRGLKVAQKYIADNHVDVIISRGPTGVLISKSTSVPVIFIEISSFDVLNALFEAKQISSRIAFFDYHYHKDKYDYEFMKNILGLEQLAVCYYRNTEDITRYIDQASAEGLDVIVASGVCIINLAQQKGLKGVIIRSTREAVIDALTRAQEIVLIGKQYREACERLKTIIDNDGNGMIVADKNSRITHFNPVAEKILRVSAGEIIGKQLDDLSEQCSLANLLKIQPGGNEIKNFGNQQYVINRLPIKSKKEDFGTVITLQEITNIQKMEEKIRQALYAKGHIARYRFSDIIGNSNSIQLAISKAKKYSLTDSTVFISGESGSGKELFAQSIHNASLRANSPFVAVNCATFPENLLESELFGYEDGAFTGAKKGGKPGIFELAHKGTIFLDEILDLPIKLQARLLRAIEEKAVRKIGGERIIPVDVRIIAATNQNLEEAVRAGEFREDLFFRLNVLNLELPPLRERSDDIPILISFFIRKFQSKFNKKVPPIPGLFVESLMSYHWPGNIRELENLIEKYVILYDGQTEQLILLDELFGELFHNYFDGGYDHDLDTVMVPVGTLEEMELEIIKNLTKNINADREVLARKLGISRTTLWKKLKQIAGEK
ncbi:MAG TPA: sigma 54-interacting transcriptional regulator [Firmicutes bacterium]|nr:sigma 54-interacting transcriptional regulator [Bacillota bacterium]